MNSEGNGAVLFALPFTKVQSLHSRPRPQKVHTLKRAGRSVPDTVARAARYCARTMECLQLADASGRNDLKAEYRRLAEHYATLAEGEQRIAASLKRITAADRRAAQARAMRGLLLQLNCFDDVMRLWATSGVLSSCTRRAAFGPRSGEPCSGVSHFPKACACAQHCQFDDGSRDGAIWQALSVVLAALLPGIRVSRRGRLPAAPARTSWLLQGTRWHTRVVRLGPWESPSPNSGAPIKDGAGAAGSHDHRTNQRS